MRKGREGRQGHEGIYIYIAHEFSIIVHISYLS